MASALVKVGSGVASALVKVGPEAASAPVSAKGAPGVGAAIVA